jgi:AcrR family transcriptional regulator
MPASESPAPARPGRRRSPEADRAIRAATMELLAEAGFGGLSMDGVAARAGVGKPTIYRRYPSKVALVCDVIRAVAEEEGPVPDTGSVRDDLVAVLARTCEALGQGPAGRIAAGLVAEMVRNAELAEAWRATAVAARRRTVLGILERGVARGELRPDADLPLVLDLIMGPVFFRLLVTGEPITADLAGPIVDAVLQGAAVDERPFR